MTELPYRPEHVNDAIADTEELSNEELGAYVRLQRALWRAGGFLPAKELGRFARAGKRWGAIAPMILRKLTIANGLASCSMQLDVLLRTRARRAAAAEKAVKAAQARWSSHGSERRRSQSSNGGLNAANTLKNNDVVMLQASVEKSYAVANQNQNHIDSENLYEKGIAALTDRVRIKALAARVQMGKWLSEVGNEGELLVIIEAAIKENLRGPPFVAIIDQRARAVGIQRKRGEMLPFGFQPNVIDGKT